MSRQTRELNYVRGAFTPVLEFSGSSTGITYSSRSGAFLKIGNVVNYSLAFQLTSKGTSVGNLTIVGLPFNAGDVNGLGEGSFDNLILDAPYTSFKGVINQFTDIILIFQEGSNIGFDLADDTNVNDNTAIELSGSYII